MSWLNGFLTGQGLELVLRHKLYVQLHRYSIQTYQHFIYTLSAQCLLQQPSPNPLTHS